MTAKLTLTGIISGGMIALINSANGHAMPWWAAGVAGICVGTAYMLGHWDGNNDYI